MQAADAVDALEARVAVDLDALGPALGVVQPERALLDVDRADGALELARTGAPKAQISR
jgi:hypothetical protein